MKKKGAALLVVIIIMMLTFLLAAIIFETSIKHLRVSSDTLESTKAYYCAETGVYDAINYIELMAKTGSFNDSYVGRNIPISNLYSKGENPENSIVYLFGDSSAIYTASIKLTKIENLEPNDEQNDEYNDVQNDKTYYCEINSEGTYNGQKYLINDTVTIFYNDNNDDNNKNGSWTYKFTGKLSTKD
ncbi:MAG TPA: pilus assembly PilX N-terminal domain-containing protein [Clostridium sp.]|uniref:pilus assembly PilX N-terminal domain-containing protein n=1 Tax=Clostridium sp. TaxID=1506 RepID=UPI002F944798